MEKRRNCSLGAISPLFHNIFYLLLDCHVLAGIRFSLQDKRLFEISEVEIVRVNCTSLPPNFLPQSLFLRFGNRKKSERPNSEEYGGRGRTLKLHLVAAAIAP